MGNVQSSSVHSTPYQKDAAGAAHNVRPLPHLDFENMPFLQPPSDSHLSATNSRNPSHSPKATMHSPGSANTEWCVGYAKWPSYNADKSPTLSHHGEITLEHDRSEIAATGGRSPSGSQSGSSIASQLSILSQVCKPNGSPRNYSFSHSGFTSKSLMEDIDVNMPPEVPPHRIFSSHNPPDQEKETALAVVEALEDEVEEDGRLTRRPTTNGHNSSLVRARSRSRSRSLSASRPASYLSCKSESELQITSEIYTRKCCCSSPEAPSLFREGENEHSDTESEELKSPDNSLFALDGYNDGTTKLRVVNWDSSPQPASFMVPSAVTYEAKKMERVRVKSKAQLAEEEEELQRRRYARYGHTFRGTSTHRVEQHTHS